MEYLLAIIIALLAAIVILLSAILKELRNRVAITINVSAPEGINASQIANAIVRELRARTAIRG